MLVTCHDQLCNAGVHHMLGMQFSFVQDQGKDEDDSNAKGVTNMHAMLKNTLNMYQA